MSAKKLTKADEDALHLLLWEVVSELGVAQTERISVNNIIAAMENSGRAAKHPRLHQRLCTRLAERKAEEKEIKGQVRAIVEKLPIWYDFFSPLRGMTTLTSSYLIAYLDPYDHTVSQCWHYAGLHVVNKCETCGRADNVTFKFKGVVSNNSLITAEGEKICGACSTIDNVTSRFHGKAPHYERGVQADWNPVLRSKLLGAVGASLIKAVRYEKGGEEKRTRKPETVGPYAQIYYDYKQRLENSKRPCGIDHSTSKKSVIQHNGCTLKHMHLKSMRYMVKLLIQDYVNASRKLRGLPVRLSYREEFLDNRKHGTS